jgi:hypothetical protein
MLGMRKSKNGDRSWTRIAIKQMPAEQRASKELVRLIVKLRWMGLEDEADCIEKQVSALTFPITDSVCAAPGEID